MLTVRLFKDLNGRILDLGGGGEGVMGQIYGRQVVAIDTLKEELDEAPGECVKLVMDATALDFGDASFDHVTSFFTLMYMDAFSQQKAIWEAARVLKPNGTLHIWDADVFSAYPQPFLITLDIDAAGKPIHTTYGIGKRDAQTAASLTAMCEAAGMRKLKTAQWEGAFYLAFQK
ncbi:MAG: class I SAM-dependent methyltransferase [Clostridiales bacterium]|nr:class I SAM-dependent methyltransferase [Clostridiales bacterium]MDY4008375.1 class I SAM-dependent methyltransferase [Candidatus Limiplasma sp.]